MDRREKERERNINVWLPVTQPQLGTWPATQACALTENRIQDSLVRRTALNPLNHTSQGHTKFLIFQLSFFWPQRALHCSWDFSTHFSSVVRVSVSLWVCEGLAVCTHAFFSFALLVSGTEQVIKSSIQ